TPPAVTTPKHACRPSRKTACSATVVATPVDTRYIWGTAEVTYEVVPTTSSLRILAIGANKQGANAAGPAFAAEDAQAVANRLEGNAKSLYHKIVKQVLPAGSATPARIQRAFAAFVANTRPQDTIVFSYGG